MNDKKTVVLLHGHGVDASIWDDIYGDLGLDGPVLKPDFARLTSHTTIEAYAEELATCLRAEKTEGVVLVGHSMGGYIALAFAEKYPERVLGLILYHSTATADTEERREQRQKTIGELKTEGTAPFIQKQLPKMVATTYPPEKTQTLVARYLNLPSDALISGMRAIAGRPDRTNVLQTAGFPILLVLGRDDQLIPHDKTAQLADLSDNISVVTIENAGHLSMVEQPETSVQIIREFMRER